MKPLSEKSGLGSAILTGQYISGDGTQSDEPVVSPSPTATAQVTPTPSITPTNTLTPSVTPSSTPFPIVTPQLWFDASDSSSMFLVLSGGNTYVSSWTSKGNSTWTLTAETSNRYPIYSASTRFPGNPQIVRFTPNASTTLRQGFSSILNTPFNFSGTSFFMVFALPSGSTYAAAAQIFRSYAADAFGSTTASISQFQSQVQSTSITNSLTTSGVSNLNSFTIPAWSGTQIGNKFLFKMNLNSAAGAPSFELNQSGGTGSVYSGNTTAVYQDTVTLGMTIASGGAKAYGTSNANIELAEIMLYNRVLSSDEQEAVELYLRDKWKYDEWDTPVVTPTATPQVTATPTNTPTPSAVPASGTTEAQTYLRAVVDGGGTGITSTVSAATITLFTSLVSNGLWDKMIAFYPMLGGNSSGCKFNGKNPLDTDGANRLVFNGGWTFNFSGATANGTNAFANSFLSASTITPLNSQHLGIYLGSNVAPAAGKTYAGAASSTPYYFVIGQDGTPRYFYGVSDAGTLTALSPNTQGNITISSSGSTNSALYKNGSLLNSAVNSNGQSIPHALYLGAMNNAGTAIQFYNNEFRFATMGSGLSTPEVSTLSTIINTFQTSLGRNTY